MDTKLWINPDNSEKVQYNTDDFPVYVRRSALSTYPNYTAVSHWHDDIELIAVLSGHMLYNVNGEITRLDAPNAYLTDYRLRRGAELLLSTNLTVTEICYEVGFSGGSYFTETFHRCLGCSPGEYRKKAPVRLDSP